MTADNIVMFLIGYFPLGASVVILTLYLLKSGNERRAEERARAAAEAEKEKRARAAEEKRKAAERERERIAAERLEKIEKRNAEKLRRAAELAELAERRLNAEREYIRLKASEAPENRFRQEPAPVIEAEPVRDSDSGAELEDSTGVYFDET